MKRSIEAFLAASSILEGDGTCEGEISVKRGADASNKCAVRIHGNIPGYIVAAYAILSSAADKTPVTLDDLIGALDIYSEIVSQSKTIKIDGLGGSDDFKNLFSE